MAGLRKLLFGDFPPWYFQDKAQFPNIMNDEKIRNHQYTKGYEFLARTFGFLLIWTEISKFCENDNIHQNFHRFQILSFHGAHMRSYWYLHDFMKIIFSKIKMCQMVANNHETSYYFFLKRSYFELKSGWKIRSNFPTTFYSDLSWAVGKLFLEIVHNVISNS